jgi:Leucine-rich repeat (LRR) protein
MILLYFRIVLPTFFILHFNLGEPLRRLWRLASGYPLHHLRRVPRLRWFRYYPSRKNARKKFFILHSSFFTPLMRQSIKTGVLERRAQRKALYALIATCEKENIIKALEIIKADENHYRAARHYYKPFYSNLYKTERLEGILSFALIDSTNVLYFVAFHYLRGTLEDVNTVIQKIELDLRLKDLSTARSDSDFIHLSALAACQHLAQENKMKAVRDANIRTLHLKPISSHECFKVSPIDARHFSRLRMLRIDKDSQYLQFFDPSKLIALEKLLLRDINIADALYFIEALPNLKELDCELNNYDGWEELKNNSLSTLSLNIIHHHTLSYDCLPDFAVNMPNLTHLSLVGFELNHANNLAKLQNLEYLRLFRISCRNEPLVIPVSPSLQHLDLDSINNLDVASISQLHNLVELRMTDCKITDISFLANLTNLKNLNIQGNEITDISALSKLKNLAHLNISNNKFTGIATLSKLKNLAHLNISRSNLTDILTLSQLKNLAYLNISNNNITDVSDLEGLTKLRKIYLEGNTLAVYPPLRTYIWIQRYDIANVFRNLEEPQEVTSLRALIRSRDKNDIAIAKQILLGRDWTEPEFDQLVHILRLY